MSILTDFIIADPAEVGEPTQETQARWGRSFPRLEFNGLDNNILAALWRAMDSTKDGLSLDRADTLVWPASSPLVIRLPDDFTQSLANVSAADVRAVATRWAAEEGMDVEGVTVEAAEYVLPQLGDFARRAQSAGKPLLLAISA